MGEHADVLMEALTLVDCFYPFVPARLTEEALPDFLKSCKAQGIATVGLTARRPDLAAATWQQLGDACVLVFDSLSPPWDDKSVKELEDLLRKGGHAAPDNPESWEGIRQDRGVWFSANANKGAVLRHTLKSGSHVIFADGSERHLHNVRDLLCDHAASTRLLHFTAAKDAAIEKLDIEHCDSSIARHCAALFQEKHADFMKLVEGKQRLLKSFIADQLDRSDLKAVQEGLHSLASSLQ